ncbi:MAG: hypothetical protein MPK30_08015, partial [Gammaproteobacteria bacterium]|nr:hypothetical protein [Gammaproteobacteria bacterium]
GGYHREFLPPVRGGAAGGEIGLGLVCNFPGIRKKSAKNKGKREKNKEKNARKTLDSGKIAENPISLHRGGGATECSFTPDTTPADTCRSRL